MGKRGFAISFKWIFALIVGLIVFLFLINFAYKHIYLSESKISSLITTSIDSQLDSISFAEDLDIEIDINQDFTINFDCDSIAIDQPLKTEKIIFSDKSIQSNKLNVWTKTWKYPFKITNFYYITNKNYYFLDPPFELLQNIPERFNIKSYPDEVQTDATLIFFKQPTTQELSQYRDHKIKIISDNKVTFYPNKITNYYGEEMLLGAIFTDDINKYNCLKNKALEKLKIIATVYQKKAETLARFSCPDKYSMIINLLENFKTNPINSEAIQNTDESIQKNDCTPLFN